MFISRIERCAVLLVALLAGIAFVQAASSSSLLRGGQALADGIDSGHRELAPKDCASDGQKSILSCSAPPGGGSKDLECCSQPFICDAEFRCLAAPLPTPPPTVAATPPPTDVATPPPTLPPIPPPTLPPITASPTDSPTAGPTLSVRLVLYLF